MDTSGQLDTTALTGAVRATVDRSIAQSAVTAALATGKPIELEVLDVATNGDAASERLALKEMMVRAGMVTIGGKTCGPGRPVRIF